MDGTAARSRKDLRWIALFEAGKGALVLLLGSGALSLLHRNVEEVAGSLVSHLHLNPAKHYPRVFLDWASGVTREHLELLAVGALLYAVLRFLEAFGLWRERNWATWFGFVTGCVYLPFEILGLIRRPGLEYGVTLVVNLLIVALLWTHLRGNLRLARAKARPPYP